MCQDPWWAAGNSYDEYGILHPFGGLLLGFSPEAGEDWDRSHQEERQQNCVSKHISCPAPYRHAPVFVGRVCNLNDVPQTDLGENLGVDHQLVICLEEFNYNHTSSFQWKWFIWGEVQLLAYHFPRNLSCATQVCTTCWSSSRVNWKYKVVQVVPGNGHYLIFCLCTNDIILKLSHSLIGKVRSLSWEWRSRQTSNQVAFWQLQSCWLIIWTSPNRLRLYSFHDRLGIHDTCSCIMITYTLAFILT